MATNSIVISFFHHFLSFSLSSPGEGSDNPIQCHFFPGENHGQRSLAVYSPWGPKESDRTERLTLFSFTWGTKILYIARCG